MRSRRVTCSAMGLLLRVRCIPELWREAAPSELAALHHGGFRVSGRRPPGPVGAHGIPRPGDAGGAVEAAPLGDRDVVCLPGGEDDWVRRPDAPRGSHERRSEVRPLDEGTARAFLGGNGWPAPPVGGRRAGDAFDPGNPVAPAGPITDTIVPGNSRACVATKSPQTGFFFDSTFGGRFPAMLKRTGFDAVVVTGRAEPPCLPRRGRGRRRPPGRARGVWGKTTRDTVEAIQATDGAETDVLAIGPRRAPRAVRVPRPLLEEPRGRRGSGASARCGARRT